MADIEIDGLANFDGIKFKFTSPMELIKEKEFPDDVLTDKGEIQLASIDTSVGKEFKMKDAGEIKFSVDAEFKAALGVYRKKANLLEALKKDGLNQQLAGLLNLEIDPGENLYAMRWGYKFGGGGDGKIPLFSMGAPVNLTFGIQGKTGGLSVLLHKRDKGDTVVEALKGTLQSWKVPAMVSSFEDLNPKTTVVFETLSDLKVALAVEYGYDFNWVRESIKIGKLSGDFGLKIEAGIKAQFGFSAVGDYVLALTRESNAEKIRVQVFRSNQKGWTFAFDGGISAQAEKVPFPNNLDDFIKGVFNLNGSQVLKDFQKWTNKDVTLAELLGTTSMDVVNDFVKKVAGIELDETIEVMTNRLKDFIEKWHELPHEVSSYLYKFIGKASGDSLTKLKGFLTTVQGLQDDDAIIAEIQKHLNFIKFFDTPDSAEFFINPIEKWLMAVSKQGIASLLAKFEDERDDFNKVVNQTLAILDGDELQKVLEKFQAEIDDKLGLDKIKDLDPNEWLLKRLTDFFESSEIVEELEKIRDVIIELNDRARDFYAVGYKALLQKYSFNVNYAFQRTTASTALIDLTLDFSGEKLEEAKKYLGQVKDGDFTSLLTGKDDETGKQITCVQINQAVFTHDIKRSVHLGVSMPNFTATLDHITNSMASGKLAETADGKLWVFNLKAEDIVKKKKSLSKLAVTVEIEEKVGIRKFSEDNSGLDYTFLFGERKAERQIIEQRYKMAARTYLKSAFPGNQNSFSNYLAELDQELDKKQIGGLTRFGNVLASLKVSMPGKVLSFLEEVPPNENDDFYKKLSGVVQESMREWVPVNYITTPEMYRKEVEDDNYPLLVWSALPVLTDEQHEKQKFKRAFYWDYKDEDKKEEVFKRDDFRNNLRAVLNRVRSETSAPGYEETDIDRMIKVVLEGQGEGNFRELCAFEKELLENIALTINLYLDFRNELNPDAKVKKLAEFGERFVDTFNDEIGHIGYTPEGALRPLGLLLLLRIAQIKKPEFKEEKFAAMLQMFVLNDQVTESEFRDVRKRFLNGEYPDEGNKNDTKKIALQQRTVNVDGPAL